MSISGNVEKLNSGLKENFSSMTNSCLCLIWIQVKYIVYKIAALCFSCRDIIMMKKSFLYFCIITMDCFTSACLYRHTCCATIIIFINTRIKRRVCHYSESGKMTGCLAAFFEVEMKKTRTADPLVRLAPAGVWMGSWGRTWDKDYILTDDMIISLLPLELEIASFYVSMIHYFWKEHMAQSILHCHKDLAGGVKWICAMSVFTDKL